MFFLCYMNVCRTNVEIVINININIDGGGRLCLNFISPADPRVGSILHHQIYKLCGSDAESADNQWVGRAS